LENVARLSFSPGTVSFDRTRPHAYGDHVTSDPTPRERFLFCAFFFVLAHAIALWFVPFATVLQAHGLEWLTPYALASTAVAAFISPIISGTMADRHFSATRLLRYLCVGTGVLLFLTFLAIQLRWHSGIILALFQLQQLCSAPVWGLASMVVLASLSSPGRQFGALRVWGTFGWIAACLLISFGLHADTSTLTGFVSSGAWLLTAALTYWLPSVQPQAAPTQRHWKDLLGLDTFQLLRHPGHRSVFLTAGLLSIPLAAFYPFTALHLHDLGFKSISAAMSLGQITEAIAMYALSPLLSRFKLRTLFLWAILTSLLRYVLFAGNSMPGLLSGVFLHGICFTLFFIPAQIYIEQHIDRAMRFRAQALMTILISGFGNLFGYLGCGWLRTLCSRDGHTLWTLYWSILAGAVLAVGLYFIRSASSLTGNKSAPTHT
jgi:MFS family permease